MKKRLAVLLSGSGTNLQALIDGVEKGRINGEIVCVIASNDAAYGIKRAAEAGIPAFVCSLKEWGDRRDREVLRILREYKADYIFLAGYLGVLSPPLVKAYPYRIVNIHPALLPKYGGKGFYGLAVHRYGTDNKTKKLKGKDERKPRKLAAPYFAAYRASAFGANRGRALPGQNTGKKDIYSQ